MNPLTKRQIEVLTAIVRFIECGGVPPTFRDLGELIGDRIREVGGFVEIGGPSLRGGAR